MATLLSHTYGKTGIRLMYVDRSRARHELRDIEVKILFEGEFAETYLSGDNSGVLPTDTVKNTVYALARSSEWSSIEEFGKNLSEHFLRRVEHLSTVHIEIAQTPWTRIADSDAAFLRGPAEMRITRIAATRPTYSIKSGIQNLQILKTANSAFRGFVKDEFTTLAPADERLLGTILDAEWTYRGDVAFDESFTKIREVMLDCFAKHNSLSVQQTLFAMAQAMLDAATEVTEVHLTMPNRHCLLVDLSKFGLENPNQIFVPTDVPSGHIEAHVIR